MSSRMQHTWNDLARVIDEFLEAHSRCPRDCNAPTTGVQYAGEALVKARDALSLAGGFLARVASGTAGLDEIVAMAKDTEAAYYKANQSVGARDEDHVTDTCVFCIRLEELRTAMQATESPSDR